MLRKWKLKQKNGFLKKKQKKNKKNKKKHVVCVMLAVSSSQV